MKKRLLVLLIALPLTVKAALPIQIPVSDPLYSQYRAWAYSQINPMLDQCAKFVNRMLLKRFNIGVYGTAWTMQLHPENQAYLQLLWRIDDESFDPENGYRLKNYEDRIAHFKALYNVLEKQENPLGVIGFLYHYSEHKYQLENTPLTLPQTHVAFLAGKTDFYITNPQDYTLDVQSILVEKYGVIHDFERDFIKSKIPLDRLLKPGESLIYQDYLIEDQFKVLRATSLLNIVLEKHWYNRVTPLLRPVSYSQLHPSILEAIDKQAQQLKTIGPITYLSGVVFESIPFEDKDVWKSELSKKMEALNHSSWQNLHLVPVPKY